MKLVKAIVTSVILIALSLQMGGCLSYMAMEHGRKQVALRKAVIKNDQAAIKAVQLGDNGVGVGIDVTNLEALKENPLLQLGAALGDAAMIYAGYKGVESLNNDGDDDKGDTTVGRDQVTINGNDNHVNVNTSEEENPTTTTTTTQ